MTPKQNTKHMVKIDSLFSLLCNLIFKLHLKNAKEKQGLMRGSQLHIYMFTREKLTNNQPSEICGREHIYIGGE